MLLRTAFKGVRLVHSLSVLFRPWLEWKYGSLEHKDDVIEEFQSREDELFNPLITSAGNNTYLRRLLNIRLYLDLSILNEGYFDENDYSSEMLQYEKFQYYIRVGTNGKLAMREYCEEIADLEAGTFDKYNKYTKQEKISKTCTNSCIKILDQEKYLRLLLDYTLYCYVMHYLDESHLLLGEEFDRYDKSTVDKIEGEELSKFIDLVMRRGIRAIEEFDQRDDELEEKDINIAERIRIRSRKDDPKKPERWP